MKPVAWPIKGLAIAAAQRKRHAMGSKDLREKHLFSYNDVFACAWNELAPSDAKSPGIVQKWFDAEDLTDAPTEGVATHRGGISHRHRDIFKYAGDCAGLNIAMFGLENQTADDWDMPSRVMMYDAMSYSAQTQRRRSGQKLVPIFTRVLYFGYNKRWKAPRRLSEQCAIPDRFRAHFQDYAVDVIELAWLTDDQIERLSGDLKAIAVCLRNFRLGELARRPDTEIAHVREVLDLLGDITGSSWFSDIKDNYESQCGRVKMCEMFEKYNAGLIAAGEERGKAEGKAEGIAEGIVIGEKRGEERGKFEGLRDMTKRIMALMNKTPEDAMNYLRLTDDEKQLVRQAF